MTDRNDPLEILDEIERFPGNEGGVITLSRTDRQSLRTALEAQRDELTQKDESYIWLESKHHNRMLENEALRARIARLEDAIRDEIADINETLKLPYRVTLSLESALNEHPRQSAAALKAEALREFAETCTSVFVVENGAVFAGLAKSAADRIKREAGFREDED